MKTKTKIKVVEVNSRGLVEITPEKLERMLNEAYQEGYNDNYYVSLTYGSTSARCNAISAVSGTSNYEAKITALEDEIVK